MKLRGLFPKAGEEIGEGKKVYGMQFPAGSRAWYENCITLKRVQLGGDWAVNDTTFYSGTIIEFAYSENEIRVKVLRDGQELS
jgi:hypothetical protein